MPKIDAILIRSILFIYMTLVIMNSIKFIGIIESIGSIGKLVFSAGFIVITLLFIDRSKVKMTLLHKRKFITIAALLIFFAVAFNLQNSNTNNLLINVAFPVYFVFYFLLAKLFVRINYSKFRALALEASKSDVLKVFRFTLFFNLLIWFPIAFGTGANMFELDGGFGGFFQDEIQMGLYAAAGFLVSFYLRFSNFNPDKSVYNNLLMGIYLFILFFASRNSLLIVITAVSFFFIISNVKNKIYRVLLILLPIVALNLNIFSVDKINEFTSGRWTIWTLATNKILDNGIVVGKGLSNFDDAILRENKGIGLYYLDHLNSLSIHSSYLELVGAGGLIALIIFFRINRKTWQRLKIIDRTVILSILIGAIFESVLVMPFMVISILFYLLLFMNNISIDHVVKKSNQN